MRAVNYSGKNMELSFSLFLLVTRIANELKLNTNTCTTTVIHVRFWLRVYWIFVHLPLPPASYKQANVYAYIHRYFFLLTRYSSSCIYATQCSIFLRMQRCVSLLCTNSFNITNWLKLTWEDNGGRSAHNTEEGAIDWIVGARTCRHFALFLCVLGYKMKI